MTSTESNQAALLTFDVDGGTFRLRSATRADLPGILRLLADDRLGATREDTSDMTPYEQAFEAIDASPAHLLVVGELLQTERTAGPAMATFQLSFLPGLSRRGSWRSQIEAVRVSAELRGRGIGAAMVRWAERLGFTASHEGMKLTL